MQRLIRLLAALGLSLLLAGPVAAQTAATATARPQPALGLVEINSASTQELDKLPGIGPARAKAIIASRPYSGKDDLVQRKVIPRYVYSRIKNKIIARQK
jgi:DNA uptake protein ComE-like DNA-binding protein